MPPATERLSATPFAVKDNIATADLPTRCASNILGDSEFPFDATIVRQLREAGFQPVSKTNMDEFGMGSHSMNSRHGPIRNPLSPPRTSHSVGGSSGGSAVTVQLGEVNFALGTDTGGSVRLPAAYTGTTGYKPSYGMISRYGVVAYANSLDTVGIIANTPEDARSPFFDTAIASQCDPYDPTSLSFKTRMRCFKSRQRDLGSRPKLTIGLPQEYNIEELDPAIRKAWIDTATALQKAGARIVPVSLADTKATLGAYYVLAAAEASSNLAKYDGVRYGTRGKESDAAGETLYSKTRGEGFGDEVKRRILLGTYSLSSEAMDNYFIQAQKVRRLVQRSFDRVFKLENPLYDAEPFDLSDLSESTAMQDKHGPVQVDFLLSPTAPTLPPTLKDINKQNSTDAYASDVFTVPASMAGLPAVSIPVPIPKSVFPAGIQLVAQYWDDQRLLDFAQTVYLMMNRQE